MPKGRKRQRGHETRHAKVRIMHSPRRGRGGVPSHTYIHTYLQSGIINYSQCESKPVCSCCVGQRCKTATAEKLKKKKKKKRRENRIKKEPPQCPGQSLSSAVEHENSVPHAGCTCSFPLSPFFLQLLLPPGKSTI